MGSHPEKSLSDEATFAGAAKRRPASEVSIGDERTLGDNRSGQDTVIDDIEVVDLEARYKVEGTLGQGGMGAVLLATDTRLDRKVAIKRILGEAAGNRMAVQRFLTEAKAIAVLNHQNIVQIYDYGRAKDGPFLIMEYVDGGSLLDRCRESALPLDEAIDLACQLCDGLAKAHDLGIIHRDIKPANVLLTQDGIPKLTDFGLAKAETGDHGQTMTGAVLGTPDFMPPEQRRDASEVDARSDLWSLAATVYQMVTGRSPKIIRFDLLPTELTKVLGKTLEDAKEARYQTARELRDALRGIVARTTTLAAGSTATGETGVPDGQCKSCGTINSDVARKFCKKCGASLRMACLKCNAHIPVWDGICGECGGNQSQLAVENKHVAEARKHLTAYDYVAALHSLEAIPESFRGEEAMQMLAESHSRHAESQQLLADITARIKRKDIDGLLPVVERAAELRGDRQDLAKIRGQLVERRDSRLARARAAMETGDVQTTVVALAGATIEEHSADEQAFITLVRRAAVLEHEIVRLVKQAKADSKVTPEEALEILEVGEEYLALNPKNEKFKLLVKQSEKLAEPLLRKRVLAKPKILNSIGIELKLLPAGTFAMGQRGGDSDETLHQVTLTKPFYIGVYEVTNAQWERVMGDVPSDWKDDDRPVEHVSWQDAIEFCNKLSALPEERKVGRVYRLPTEAEWEYACRADTDTKHFFGDDESKLDEFGWYDGNSQKKPHHVGKKKPNAWGLYDLHGNVWEWCSDWYGDYPKGAVTNPQGPSGASARVIRGGCWRNAAGLCRSASRDKFDPSVRNDRLGFRLALSSTGTQSVPPEVLELD